MVEAQEHIEAFALVYKVGYTSYYLPTDPEARVWRGPFLSEQARHLAQYKELGCEPYETVTKFPPRSLPQE